MRKLVLLIMMFVLAACSGKPSAPMPTQVASAHVEPTSIILQPTPAPTYTAQAAQVTVSTPTQLPTVDPFSDDPPYYYGGLVMTMEDVGTTLPMRLKGSFMLSLGSDYIWSVTVDPPGLLSLNRKVTPELGEQGVYIARQKGKGALRAVGEPVCRRLEPACVRPDVLYTLHILVE